MRLAESSPSIMGLQPCREVLAADGYAWLCALCRGAGELLWCKECGQSFHLHCLGLNSFPLEEYWLCKDCTINKDLKLIQNESQTDETLGVEEHCCDASAFSLQIPLGREKQGPQPYVSIQRNIYLIRKPKRRSEDEFMQCSCRQAGGTRAKCGKDCICWMLQYSCSSSCGCGESCLNLPFQKCNGRKLHLVKTEKCGWGLIAGEEIKAGDFLIEYVGEVIDDKTCEERLWRMKEMGETNFYLCEISREVVIDSSFKGNISRFINHSCCPNTQLEKWQIDEEIRIGVFAISDIRPGEAITYDYQFIAFGTDQKCFCGAKSCRGMLGCRPSRQSSVALQIVTREVMTQSNKKRKICEQKGLSRKIDEFFRQQKPKLHSLTCTEAWSPHVKSKSKTTCVGLRIRVWWPLDKKFYSGKIADFNSHDGTHKIEYDDGDIEILSMDKEKWELDMTPVKQQ